MEEEIVRATPKLQEQGIERRPITEQYPLQFGNFTGQEAGLRCMEAVFGADTMIVHGASTLSTWKCAELDPAAEIRCYLSQAYAAQRETTMRTRFGLFVKRYDI